MGLNSLVSATPIRLAFSNWPTVNDRLTQAVSGLGVEELAWSAAPGRWPLWAVVGHAACQRVFWLCDFAGEAGATSTRFTDAAWNCPGDDDLVNALDADQLVEALTSTFAIIDGVLSRWTIEGLAEELRQPTWGDDRRQTRGAVIQRVYSHDVWHAAEANEILTRHNLTGFDPWT
jgi:hypothetical protein